MTKRKTKAQREREKYEALWQRVYDVVCGACGREFDEAIDTDPSEWLTLEEVQRVIGALESIFEGPCVNEESKRTRFGWLFGTHQLEHFENVAKIVDHLFDGGVRA